MTGDEMLELLKVFISETTHVKEKLRNRITLTRQDALVFRDKCAAMYHKFDAIAGGHTILVSEKQETWRDRPSML